MTLRFCGGTWGPTGERFPGSSGSSEFDPSTTVLRGRPQGGDGTIIRTIGDGDYRKVRVCIARELQDTSLVEWIGLRPCQIKDLKDLTSFECIARWLPDDCQMIARWLPVSLMCGWSLLVDLTLCYVSAYKSTISSSFPIVPINRAIWIIVTMLGLQYHLGHIM